MDSSRLKNIDRFLGTPLIVLLGAWEWVRRLLSPARRRRGFDLSAPRRIAIVKTVAIGDVVQALPTVKALRGRFPHAHITFIVTPRVREVVEGLPFVDEVRYFDVFGAHGGISGVVRFARELRAQHYDMWIELEHYYRFTTILGYLSGAPVRVGFSIPGQVRRFLFTITAPYPTQKHELESFLSIARVLGACVEGASPVPIPASEDDARVAREWLAGAGAALPAAQRERGIVILHTTTSPIAVSRRWSADRWIELADRIAERYGLTAVFTGAPDEAADLRALASRTAQPSLVSAGALTLRQFSVLAGQARLMVSVDTGPLHVAAATGVPIVALFGPGDPRKWRPYGPGNAVVRAGLACSPCSTHYTGRISRKTCDDCMRAISVEDVLHAIESLPKGPPPLSPAGDAGAAHVVGQVGRLAGKDEAK